MRHLSLVYTWPASPYQPASTYGARTLSSTHLSLVTGTWPALHKRVLTKSVDAEM